MPNIVGMPKSSSQVRSKKEDLLRNSQKYDSMMKVRKDELKRKRGALELNSDAEPDVDTRGADITPKGGKFRSKLHDDIKRQEREAKE